MQVAALWLVGLWFGISIGITILSTIYTLNNSTILSPLKNALD